MTKVTRYSWIAGPWSPTPQTQAFTVVLASLFSPLPGGTSGVLREGSQPGLDLLVSSQRKQRAEQSREVTRKGGRERALLGKSSAKNPGTEICFLDCHCAYKSSHTSDAESSSAALGRGPRPPAFLPGSQVTLLLWAQGNTA